MVEPLPVLAELTRFGRALTGALRRETVADSTRECLERVFAPGAGALALATEQSGRFALAAAFGNPTPLADDPFFTEVHRAGRVVRHAHPARLGTPIVAAGHTMGIVAVWGNPDAADFDQQSEEVIAAIAAQAAIALQNTRLIEILSAGKQEWEQLVDAIRPAIAIVDASGSVRRANLAFARLVGAPVTALNGRPWLLLLPPGWAEPVLFEPTPPSSRATRLRSEQTPAQSLACSWLPLASIGQVDRSM